MMENFDFLSAMIGFGVGVFVILLWIATCPKLDD